MLIPNLTEYRIYSRKLGYHAIKLMPTKYPNTYKAILSNSELINDIFNKTFLCPLHEMSITLEMIITGYPKVL